MKLTAFILFSILILIYPVKAAQEVNTARNVLQARGLIVRTNKTCPKTKETFLSYPIKYLTTKIDKIRSATVVFTELCNGGNMLQEYLVLTKGTKGVWLENADIGDLNFSVEAISARADHILLKGQRWKGSDPHCCPSLSGILSYNIITKKQRFISRSEIEKSNQEYEFNDERINTQHLNLQSKSRKVMENLSTRIRPFFAKTGHADAQKDNLQKYKHHFGVNPN